MIICIYIYVYIHIYTYVQGDGKFDRTEMMGVIKRVRAEEEQKKEYKNMAFKLLIGIIFICVLFGGMMFCTMYFVIEMTKEMKANPNSKSTETTRLIDPTGKPIGVR